MLSEITTGVTVKPPRIIVYGVEGVGKSSFAASFPNPIFIQTEEGLDRINCSKFPLSRNIEDVKNQLQSLINESHAYKTVVIDSLDWLEPMVWEKTCRRFSVDNIEKVMKGYGKGFIQALDEWNGLLNSLNILRERKMAIILIAHAKVERFEDPDSVGYDRYSPRLQKLATALLTEWADAVLFASYKMSIEIAQTKAGKERAIAVPERDPLAPSSGAKRILRCNGGPAALAKNRFGLPDEIDLTFEAFRLNAKL